MSIRPSNNPITHETNNQHLNIERYPQCTYHIPEPTNTFRVNPLVFSSLKHLDIDNVQYALGKVIQDNNHKQEFNQLKRQKVIEESDELKILKSKIQSAYMNQTRAHQIQECQARKMQEVIKDSEVDEVVLSNLKKERQMEKEMQNKKRQDRFNAKYILQDQMKDREKQKQESMKEYQRDKELVNDAVNKIRAEDISEYEQDQRKKAINKKYMENAYAEKVERRKEEKENEERRKETEKKYLEEVANREREYQMKKNAIKEENDKIFEQLCWEKAQDQAQKEHWETIRNDLYIEEEKRKAKLMELDEKEKKQRQKEQMLQWAIEQMKLKEQKKQEEEQMEAEFKKILLEKYAAEERLEQYNLIKRKQKQLDMKNEIEKQWKLKLEQYQMQKENELAELENAKRIEREKRIIIEEEKARLIKENEEILKTHFANAYYQSVKGLETNNPNNQPFNNLHQQGEFNLSPLSSFSSK